MRDPKWARGAREVRGWCAGGRAGGRCGREGSGREDARVGPGACVRGRGLSPGRPPGPAPRRCARRPEAGLAGKSRGRRGCDRTAPLRASRASRRYARKWGACSPGSRTRVDPRSATAASEPRAEQTAVSSARGSDGDLRPSRARRLPGRCSLTLPWREWGVPGAESRQSRVVTGPAFWVLRHQAAPGPRRPRPGRARYCAGAFLAAAENENVS